VASINLSGTFKLGNRVVQRVGYGAMQLAGPGVFGPPKNHDTALTVLREAVASGVNHIPLGGFTPLQSSTLSDVAGRLKVTPMVVALAWLLHRSPNILLIPGTSSVAHLRENLAAAQLPLSPQTLAELDGIAS
jgi:aryl-alcohol dehydrogenase-like predicted oxidoreductase